MSCQQEYTRSARGLGLLRRQGGPVLFETLPQHRKWMHLAHGRLTLRLDFLGFTVYI